MATLKDPKRSPLLLAKETALLTQAGVTREATCRVYQTLMNGLTTYLEFDGTKMEDFLDERPVDVHLPKSGLRCHGFTSGIEFTFDFQRRRRSMKQKVFPTSEPMQVGQSRDLRIVEFAVANGSSFYFERTYNGKPIDDMTLEIDEWVVNICAPTRKHRTLEASMESDGTKLTHSGTLQKIGRQKFTSSEADAMLSVLSIFLSFAAGWWVGIVFARGRNSKKKLAWQQWGSGPVQPVGPGYSWHHWKMMGMLADLFPGFVRLLQRTESREAMQLVLYWYNRSNSRGAGDDGSIILTQAAFELLAWHVLVHETKLLSEDNFRSLNAEGQIRVLLGQLGVPLAIPAGLSSLNRLAQEFNWSCAPQALVAIRNQLVHPAKKRGKPPRRPNEYPYHESWLLGQQLLELCVLRLSGYQGTFMDRTRSGPGSEPKPVPWIR